MNLLEFLNSIKWWALIIGLGVYLGWDVVLPMLMKATEIKIQIPG